MDIDTILFFEVISTLMVIAVGVFHGILKGIEIRWYFKKRKFLKNMMTDEEEYYSKILRDLQEEINESPLRCFYQNWIKN